MLYKLRTGDILICKNKIEHQTNAYLIVYDPVNGFGLWCVGCGEALGFYGNNIDKMKSDILDKNFLNIQAIVPKEVMANYFNSNYKLDLPVKAHDGLKDLNIEIELDD